MVWNCRYSHRDLSWVAASSSTLWCMVALLTLDDVGFVGQFLPTEVRGPAVLIFSGSGGGHPGPEYGPALVSMGFSTLALTYFDAPVLPPDLHDIPIEYFLTALTWLRTQPTVDPAQVFVISRSRGTEAAQLLALHTTAEIAGLVLAVPSYVVVQAYPGEGAAWTWEGEPIAHHPDGWPTDSFPVDPPAVLPLEDYPGPVMLVSGGRDQIWPSPDFARAIKARRDRDNRVTEHWYYPQAGHAVGTLLDLAGTATGPEDVTARRAAWQRTTNFLRANSHPE